MTIPEQLAKALADLAAANDALAAERANVTTITTQLEAEKATSASATNALGELNTKLNAAEGSVAFLKNEVESLKASAKSATEQATEMAARVGVNPVAPAGNGPAASADMTLEEVRAALAKTNDPKEKGRLAMLSRKIRGIV